MSARTRRRLVATSLTALLLVGVTAAPALAATDDDSSVPLTVTVPESADGQYGTIDDAELRWGLNRESSSGAFAGGCNFLSAGRAGDSGGARMWTAADGFYSAAEGEVEIVKQTADGGWARADFASRCLDPQGNPVSVSSLTSSTRSQVVIGGGSGEITRDNGLRISWTGSFTVAFYGGMTYWSASDPQLVVDANGTGRLTATASGYGTSMGDMTKWEPIAPRSIVLAEVRGVGLGGQRGFAVVPEYLGVAATPASGQVPRTSENAAHWGAFPASFLEFQGLTGQTGYWVTTGGQRDVAKPASVLTVNYDAENPVVTPPTTPPGENGGDGTGGADPDNPVEFRPDAPATSASGSSGGRGSSAGAVPALAEGGLAVIAGNAIMAVRDNGIGLVPIATEVDRRMLLPIGGTVLTLLVSTLAVLNITGRLRFPWSR